MAQCQIHKVHEDGSYVPEIKCQNPALPGDPNGLCLLHSRDKKKDSEGAFNAAIKEKLTRQDYDFRRVFFPDRTNFAGAVFRNINVDFSGSSFSGLADFSKATFKQQAWFSGVNFETWANFSECSFEKGTDFCRAVFTKEADFSWATFTKKVDFSTSYFMELSNFHGAKFAEASDFSTAVFIKGADFSEVVFTERIDFFGATFNEKADFSRTIFMAGANFEKATFIEDASFNIATIRGRVVLRSINSKDYEVHVYPFKASFQNIEFQDQGFLCFQDISLENVLFAGTHLDHAEFHHVQWRAYRGRQAIYDEVLLRKEVKGNPWLLVPICQHIVNIPIPWVDRYGAVERLYRYIKINYESQGDYKNAGDFHYGEMEMHRRVSKWRWFPFYWYNFYWYLSGYGERPSRALAWLAGFLLALPLLVWGFGLDRVAGGTTPGFLETFTYIFEKVTFQRPPLLSNLNLLGRFISNLSLLIIPGQAALFLLALRNRLGRRR